MEPEYRTKDFRPFILDSLNQISTTRKNLSDTNLAKHLHSYYFKSTMSSKKNNSETDIDLTDDATPIKEGKKEIPLPIDHQTSRQNQSSVNKQTELEELQLQSMFMMSTEDKMKQAHYFRRLGMSFVDTVLLVAPSATWFIHSLLSKNQDDKKISLTWMLIAFVGCVLKSRHANAKFQWWNLAINPFYLFIARGIQGNWRNGVILSVTWFIASILSMRAGGIVSVKLLNKNVN